LELIERFSLSRRAGFKVGTLMAVMIGFAIFVLGAPPVILIPVSVIGSTIHMELRLRAMRNLERKS
jgi:DMSO reductase anchor subunit